MTPAREAGVRQELARHGGRLLKRWGRVGPSASARYQVVSRAGLLLARDSVLGWPLERVYAWASPDLASWSPEISRGGRS